MVEERVGKVRRSSLITCTDNVGKTLGQRCKALAIDCTLDIGQLYWADIGPLFHFSSGPMSSNNH